MITINDAKLKAFTTDLLDLGKALHDDMVDALAYGSRTGRVIRDPRTTPEPVSEPRRYIVVPPNAQPPHALCHVCRRPLSYEEHLAHPWCPDCVEAAHEYADSFVSKDDPAYTVYIAIWMGRVRRMVRP